MSNTEASEKERISLTMALMRWGSLVAITSALWIHLDLGSHSQEMWPFYLAAAGIYISGRIADKVSTIKAFESAREFHELDGRHPLREMNPLLPEVPQTKDMLSPRRLFFDVAHLLPSVIIPPVGIIYGGLSWHAAIHNLKLKRNIDKNIEDYKKFLSEE